VLLGVVSNRSLFQKCVDLGSGLINSLSVKDGFIYSNSAGNSVIINSFDLSSLGNYGRIKIYKGTMDAGSNITIKSGAGVLTPDGTDLVLSKADEVYTFERLFNSSWLRLVH
jgi:hypothetical protein